MNENKDLIQTLLSKGIAHHENVDLSRMNQIFMKLGYEAVEFPHRRIIVLKDRLTDKTSDPIWTEERIKEAQQILEIISKNITDNKREIPNELKNTVELMIKNNYLRIEEDELSLTERSLVQFSEIIEKYLCKCELCGFITEEGQYHKECKEILKKN